MDYLVWVDNGGVYVVTTNVAEADIPKQVKAPDRRCVKMVPLAEVFQRECTQGYSVVDAGLTVDEVRVNSVVRRQGPDEMLWVVKMTFPQRPGDVHTAVVSSGRGERTADVLKAINVTEDYEISIIRVEHLFTGKSKPSTIRKRGYPMVSFGESIVYVRGLYKEPQGSVVDAKALLLPDSKSISG